MTKEICEHHFWGIIWGISASIFLVFIIINGINASHYDFQQPDITNASQSVKDYGNQFYSVNGFIASIIGFVLINSVGIFFANMRYNWIALKECSKI